MTAVVNLVSDISVFCRPNCCKKNYFYLFLFLGVGKVRKCKVRKKRSYSDPTEVQKNRWGLWKEKTIIFGDKTNA